jgi:hypothetical protein
MWDIYVGIEHPSCRVLYNVHVAVLWDLLLFSLVMQYLLWIFLDFYTGVVEGSILVRFDPAAVDNWSPLLLRQDIWPVRWDHHIFLSGGNWLPTDTALYPTRTETSVFSFFVYAFNLLNWAPYEPILNHTMHQTCFAVHFQLVNIY